MAGPVIAVTDSVFPSLDLAKAALAKLNPTYRMSKGVTADDILRVARTYLDPNRALVSTVEQSVPDRSRRPTTAGASGSEMSTTSTPVATQPT